MFFLPFLPFKKVTKAGRKQGLRHKSARRFPVKVHRGRGQNFPIFISCHYLVELDPRQLATGSTGARQFLRTSAFATRHVLGLWISFPFVLAKACHALDEMRLGGNPTEGQAEMQGLRTHVWCTPRGSCTCTLLSRVLRRFSNSKCFLEGFLEGACKGFQ